MPGSMNPSSQSHHIWVNYNNSLTWIKASWGWFPLLTMIPVRSQWGRYNLPRSHQANECLRRLFHHCLSARWTSSIWVDSLDIERPVTLSCKLQPHHVFKLFNVLVYLDQFWTTRPSLGCALHSIPCLGLGTSVLASCGTGSISLNTTLAKSAHKKTIRLSSNPMGQACGTTRHGFTLW